MNKYYKVTDVCKICQYNNDCPKNVMDNFIDASYFLNKFREEHPEIFETVKIGLVCKKSYDRRK